MNRRTLLDPLGNAITVALCISTLYAWVFLVHSLPEIAQRAADVQRWHAEGCSTDTDCERMEATIGLDHLSK